MSIAAARFIAARFTPTSATTTSSTTTRSATVAIGRLLPIMAMLLLSACATLSAPQRDRAAAIAHAARSTALDCSAAQACAQPSPLRELAARALADSTVASPRHYALILDRGSDALLARINLIRSATTAVDLQTYIFAEDDAGRLVLDELLAAARRGVQVRLLMDQLSGLEHVDTLAALAGAHANFQVRLYNPMLGRARINYPQYVLAAACCWRQLNQRMHTKLLLIDGAAGITGGRNYQNDYYDWDGAYNFRDRDVLVAGPSARDMGRDFDAFWNDHRSVPAERLSDVGRRLLQVGVPALPAPHYQRPLRVAAMRAAAGDNALVQATLASRALPVGAVEYVSDLPDKHGELIAGTAVASRSLRALIESAQEEVLLQTPYLVLSKPAQRLFRQLRARPHRPRVVVSTNSLAATDAFIAYALSYKYKRRYLREFGFNIYEYKPFPQDAPIDFALLGPSPDDAAAQSPSTLAMSPSGSKASAGADARPAPADTAPAASARDEHADPAPAAASPTAAQTARRHRLLRDRYDRNSAVGRAQYRAALTHEYSALRYARRRANEPVPLQRAGARMGLHAKSLVIDERIGVIGTHNFDPRGDRYNTESAVVIDDPVFARALADSIRRDLSPANAWVIAPRDKPLVLSGLQYSLAKLSERMPLFDLWPTRYATSYDFVPGPQCLRPLPPDNPDFRACYKPVGDFPEVDLGLKSVTTRIFTAFGAGLAPIL